MEKEAKITVNPSFELSLIHIWFVDGVQVKNPHDPKHT